MFINPTTLILGAGASWHYGYPTGEKLIDNVILMAGRLSDYCDNRLQCGQTIQVLPAYVEQRLHQKQGIADASHAWQVVRDECQMLIARLRSVRPLLIDHFLAWNESLRPIGKLMIAAAILECEAAWLKHRANQNRRLDFENSPLRPAHQEHQHLDITKYRDNWYRFIVHKLVYNCETSSDIFKNKVHFVTFNYDNSLEYQLHDALSSVDLLTTDDVKRFLTDGRIVHVYGSVHEGIPTNDAIVQHDVANTLGVQLPSSIDFAQDFKPKKTFLDRCLVASEKLRTIDPTDKEDDGAVLNLARAWISEAGVVYILGYGFDASNNHRIEIEKALDNSLAASGKCVMFTNFGDMDTINKKASKLFFGSYGGFLGHKIHGEPLMGNYVEKSARNVYDALEQDFDALENELVRSTTLQDLGL